jgi:vancomycin aglycone glucosyltransferase
MRVLMAPEGSRGDVQPLVALGATLAARGCQVRVCAYPEARELAEPHGLEFVTHGTDTRAMIEQQAEAIHGGWLAFQRAVNPLFDEMLESQFTHLTEAARDVDLIIGGGVQFGGPSIAEALGVPYRFVAYCPILFPSSEHPPFMVERQIRTPWLNRGLWRVFVATLGAQIRRGLNRHRAALGLDPIRDVFASLCGEEPLLAADPDLAPGARDGPIAYQQVGFLHPPDAGDRLPEKLEAFLAAGPPPIYVGFGSMPDPHPEQTTQRLLKVIAARRARAVISAGWAGLGSGPLSDDVLVVGTVPHAKLFPRVAAVVHHGGAGTTSSAARAGAPQVLVPHLLDQFYFARRVRELGIGVATEARRGLDFATLSECIDAVLENEILAERADALGERMRARDPHGAAADRLLSTER